MQNKYWTFVIIITVLLGAIIFIISRQSGSDEIDLYSTIPEDAALIIETDNAETFFNNIRNENKIWEELLNTSYFIEINKDLELLDTLFSTSRELQIISNEMSQAALSLHLVNDSYIPAYYFIFNQDITDNVLLKAIKDIAPYSIQKSGFKGSQLYNLKFKKSNLSLIITGNLAVVSLSESLVKNIANQVVSKTSLRNNQGFRQVLKTAGRNVDANLFVNHKHFNRFLAHQVSPNFKGAVLREDNFGEWTSLDISIKENIVYFNGFTYSPDTALYYLKTFKGQSPRSIDIPSILPSNTYFFQVLALSDLNKFSQNLQQFRNETNRIPAESKAFKKTKEILGMELNSFFNDFVDEELCYAHIGDEGREKDMHSVIVLKTKGSSIAKEKLMELISAYSTASGLEKGNLTADISLDAQTKFPLFYIPEKNLFTIMYGNVLPTGEYKYITLVDNYLIAAQNKELLQEFAHSFVLKTSLDNEESFQEFSTHFSSYCNFYLFCNIPASFNYTKHFVNQQIKDSIAAALPNISNIRSFGYQFNADDKMIYNNMFIKYSSHVTEKTGTDWESQLDTTIDFKPVFFTNHYTHEKEVLVQDLKNNLYLINQTGRILWKVKLKEKIESEIFTVDYFKNGKFQILFSTKSQIHLLDRNGNNVERYPIDLRAQATNGVNLFDYDKDLNYRLFIACEDKKVYCYNIEGNILKGWEFDKTDHFVTQPIQHFAYNSKDYIVFSDKNKNYIVDRRGSTRIKVKEDFSRSMHNSFYFEELTENDARFVTTSTNGEVCFITLDGDVKKQEVVDLTEHHSFDYQDIDADNVKDFIFVDKNKLIVYTQNKKRIFDYKFNNVIRHKPICFEFARNDKKIGIVDAESKELYLFNGNGDLYKDFPLKGSTLFSIGKFSNIKGKFNLIVGNNNNFLYNYTVQ